jgi:hypothetical protein
VPVWGEAGKAAKAGGLGETVFAQVAGTKYFMNEASPAWKSSALNAEHQ